MDSPVPAGAAEQQRSPADWAKAFASPLLLGLLLSILGPGGHRFGALELGLVSVLGLLAVFLSGTYCLLGPAFRHVYNYHYLVGLGGLGIGWALAEQGAGTRPMALALIFPGAAAFSLSMLACTAVTDRRTAVLICAAVFSLVVVAARPFAIGPLNIVLGLVPAALAATVVRQGTAARLAVRPESAPPILEASISQRGYAYVVMNLVLAAMLLVVLKWSFGDYFRMAWDWIASSVTLEESEEGVAMVERFTAFPGKWLGCRLALAIAAGGMAAIIATATQFRTADPFKAGACVFAAACGANMAGGGIGTLNLLFAMIGCAVIAGACGILFAGGMRKDRLPRPVLAAGMAMVLAINLVEPMLPAPLDSPWAALAVFTELLVLGAFWAVVYWFGIVRVRDRWPKPMPRQDYFLRDPPPVMPLPQRGGRKY